MGCYTTNVHNLNFLKKEIRSHNGNFLRNKASKNNCSGVHFYRRKIV